MFDYDERGLLKKANIGHNHLTNLVIYDYLYDANGNRKSQTFRQELITPNTGTTQQGFISATVNYTYDAQNQLKSETLPVGGESLHYEYDVLGNRVKTISKKGTSTTKTVEHVFNQRNQLITIKDGVSTQNWRYDDSGNLLDDGKFTYVWDAEHGALVVIRLEACLRYNTQFKPNNPFHLLLRVGLQQATSMRCRRSVFTTIKIHISYV